MYDAELHMRFMRSATEAWYNSMTAGWAAMEHLCDHMADPADRNLPLYLNPFAWWSGLLNTQSMMAGKPADFGSQFFQFAQPNGSNGLPNGFMNCLASEPWMKAWANMMSPFSWAQPWNFFEMSMTTLLMSTTGMPFAVASPAAKAHAASLDAADAAREGMRLVASSYRGDSGYAMAPFANWMKLALLFLAPWMAMLPSLPSA